jgi:hypothetical protein
MNLKNLAILIVALCVTNPLCADENFWEDPDAYLKQARPAETPRIFAPGLLADPGMFVLGRIAFSRDGKEIYYSQNNSWNSGDYARIKMVRYANRHWSKPISLHDRFVTPTLSFDGTVMYMRKANNMNNVWQSHRENGGWSAPKPFLEKNFGVYDFMPTLSGNAYVGSNPGSEDIKFGSTYVFSLLTMTNEEVRVTSLGQPLNAKGWNGDLFVASDESYMIISANETKSFESELYISFRKADATWTTPVSLGPQINNGLAHRWGHYVTPDGKFLFYSHGTSEKDCAIWWVRFDGLLSRLKPAKP